jgi:hypothetical protein
MKVMIAKTSNKLSPMLAKSLGLVGALVGSGHRIGTDIRCSGRLQPSIDRNFWKMET